MKTSVETHDAQQDLDGKPAILHPLTVELMGKTDAEIKAGVNRNHECTENGKVSAQKTVTTVHKNQ